MLDTNHPHAAHIFTASRQLGAVLDGCKRITLCVTRAQRRFLLETFRPAFAALRWLNTERFNHSAAIIARIDQLETQATAVAGLSPTDPKAPGFPPERCLVCQTSFRAPSRYEPMPYCPSCLRVVMPALQRLESFEQGFGTDGI